MMKYIFIIQTGFTGLKPLPRIARITQITRTRSVDGVRLRRTTSIKKHSWNGLRLAALASIGVICGLKNPVNPVKER